MFKTLIEHFAANEYDADLQQTITEYIVGQAELQTVSNPSGDLTDGSGLGEAKFHVDLSQFTDAWGKQNSIFPLPNAGTLVFLWLTRHRPPPARRPAPASHRHDELREVADGERLPRHRPGAALARHPQRPLLYRPVLVGLPPFISAQTTRFHANTRDRNETGFDLWEEVSGASFFTTISQYRALVEGSALAAELRTTCKACDEIAPHVLCFLQSYWNNQGYITSNSMPSRPPSAPTS